MGTEILTQCLSELVVIEMRVLGWYKGLLEILDMKRLYDTGDGRDRTTLKTQSLCGRRLERSGLTQKTRNSSREKIGPEIQADLTEHKNTSETEPEDH